MNPHFFEVHDPANIARQGEWCKHCNTSRDEVPGLHVQAGAEDFADFVSSHGFGAPTAEGYRVGATLIAEGDDVATAATEVSARGLTEFPEAKY